MITHQSPIRIGSSNLMTPKRKVLHYLQMKEIFEQLFLETDDDKMCENNLALFYLHLQLKFQSFIRASNSVSIDIGNKDKQKSKQETKYATVMEYFVYL